MSEVCYHCGTDTGKARNLVHELAAANERIARLEKVREAAVYYLLVIAPTHRPMLLQHLEDALNMAVSEPERQLIKALAEAEK